MPAAAKAGMNNLTRSLAVRYARLGIRSNGVVLGAVDTPMIRPRLEATLAAVARGEPPEEPVRSGPLLERIAGIRTWTYVSHRPGWLADPETWQARTRRIEDRLSDALHEMLRSEFVNRGAFFLAAWLAAIARHVDKHLFHLLAAIAGEELAGPLWLPLPERHASELPLRRLDAARPGRLERPLGRVETARLQ